MIAEIVDACRKSDVQVVVKRHPMCKAKSISKLLDARQAAGDIVVSTASIHDLIEGSCAVCTVNSSVGIEALLHLKPVYLFGHADYHHVCFPILHAKEFEAKFVPNKLPVSDITIKRFLYHFRSHNILDLKKPETTRRLLRQNISELMKGRSALVEERADERDSLARLS